MRSPTTHRLERIHIEMKALKDKGSSDPKLTKSAQTKLDRFAVERDEVVISLFLPVYYQPSITPP